MVYNVYKRQRCCVLLFNKNRAVFITLIHRFMPPAVAPTPWGTGGTSPPLLQMTARGALRVEETDQTVLTITKALTKTTNCTCRAKQVEGHF